VQRLAPTAVNTVPVPRRTAARTYAPGFVFLLMATCTLFVRPSEFVKDIRDQRLYLVAILGCLACSFPAVVGQLNWRSIATRPITACLFGLLAMVVLSPLSRLQVSQAITEGFEFAKVITYYLLVVGLLDRGARIRAFVFWLTLFVLAVASLVALSYYNIFPHIPAGMMDRFFDRETGDEVMVLRLGTTGLFRDPNDICLMLLVGLALAGYWFTQARGLRQRVAWLAAVGLLLHCIALTQSRGGFLALLGGLAVFFRERFGLGRSLMVGALVVPLMFVVFAGRQTTISHREGTGQQRMGVWSEGLVLFRQNPVFGIGQNEYKEQVGLVAHNSYLHCFTELGLAGGLCFMGAFTCAVGGLGSLARRSAEIADPAIRGLRPFLLAGIAAYGIALLWLSNSYTVPTLLVFALATAYVNVSDVELAPPYHQLNGRLLGRVAVISLVFLGAMSVLVRLLLERS
jgi:O-antigen ligase